jgi:hypothetical protein
LRKRVVKFFFVWYNAEISGKEGLLMELTPQILLVVLPLIFLGGFVDSVAGGGGLITCPLT